MSQSKSITYHVVKKQCNTYSAVVFGLYIIGTSFLIAGIFYSKDLIKCTAPNNLSHNICIRLYLDSVR